MYPYGFGIYRGLYHMSSGSSTFCFLIGCLTVVALWILFDKAGEPGWAAIVPLYNFYELFKITWGNGWYFLLLLIPIANIVIGIITLVKLAGAFGKGGGWACGLIFLYPIFLCITAFNRDIVYVGVPGKTADYSYGNRADYGYGTGTKQDYQGPSQQQAEPETDQQKENRYAQSAQNPDYYYRQTAHGTGNVKYCSGCGAKLGADDKFCPSCGREVK